MVVGKGWRRGGEWRTSLPSFALAPDIRPFGGDYLRNNGGKALLYQDHLDRPTTVLVNEYRKMGIHIHTYNVHELRSEEDMIIVGRSNG